MKNNESIVTVPVLDGIDDNFIEYVKNATKVRKEKALANNEPYAFTAYDALTNMLLSMNKRGLNKKTIERCGLDYEEYNSHIKAMYLVAIESAEKEMTADGFKESQDRFYEVIGQWFDFIGGNMHIKLKKSPSDYGFIGRHSRSLKKGKAKSSDDGTPDFYSGAEGLISDRAQGKTSVKFALELLTVYRIFGRVPCVKGEWITIRDEFNRKDKEKAEKNQKKNDAQAEKEQNQKNIESKRAKQAKNNAKSEPAA